MISFIILLILLLKNGRTRYDGSPSLPYFNSEDLGLNEQRFYFYSGKNKLYGSKYFKNQVKIKGIIIFFHGLGAGRTAYLNLINCLANEGYLIYAYDNSGCMQSEGKGYRGLQQSLNDLDAFFNFLKSENVANNYPYFVIGHSWGGYVALMSLKNKYNVKKCVSIAGFLDPNEEIIDTIKLTKIPFIKFILKLANGLLFKRIKNINAVDVIAKSNAKILYIQGSSDNIVLFDKNGKVLERKFINNKNIKFMFLNNRYHSPYLSESAEKYINLYFKNMQQKTDNNEKMDINKACEINESVIKAIFDFFNE